jgi:hypothetical protein
MNLTRIPIVDAQPGMVASIDGDTATVTKVRRRRGSDYLSVTFVDDLGSVFARRLGKRMGGAGHRHIRTTPGPGRLIPDQGNATAGAVRSQPRARS